MLRRQLALIVAVLVSVSCLLTLGASAQPARSKKAEVSQPSGTAVLYASKDSYITEADEFSNFGGDGGLLVGRQSGSNYRALLQFDLSGIPAWAEVTSATLELEKIINMTSQGQDTTLAQSMYADLLTAPWTEYGVAWTNRPGMLHLSDPPSVVNGGLTYAWNVTNIVDAWLSGDQGNNGLQIRGDGVTEELPSFFSREAAGGADPKLTIAYIVNTPTPTPTATASSTPTATRTATATATATATVAHSEITLSKTLSEPSGGVAEQGDIVTFIIKVQNSGAEEIVTVPLVDNWDPTCLQFKSAYPPQDAWWLEGPALWYDLGPLAPGESVWVNTTFDTVGVCDPATNTAGVNTAVDANGHDVPPVISSAEITILPGPTGTPTPTPTPYPSVEGSCPGEVTIWADKDTWLDESRPNETHGADRDLLLAREDNAWKLALFHFPIEDAAIPAQMQIYSADMMAYVSGYEQPLTQVAFIVRRLAAGWDETTVNWSNYGHMGEGNLSNTTQSMSDPLHTWSITDQVRRWHSGENENNGVMLESHSNMAVTYSSREERRDLQPRLVISCGFQTPTPTPTRTPTSTITPTPTVTPTSLPLDWRIDALQVTQGISTYQSSPVFVANKPTFLLAFASVHENGVQVTKHAPHIWLTAMRDGQPLDPPYLSVVSDPEMLWDTGWDPGEKTHAYLWEMPYDWLHGDVEVSAEIEGSLEDPSTLGDNTFTRLVDFTDTDPICMIYVRVRTLEGWPAKWFMFDTQEGYDIRERALTLLPAAEFWGWVQDGVAEKLDLCAEFIPCGYTHYSPEDNDDGEDILDTLWWRNVFTDDPDVCDDRGADTHYAGMITPEGETANGMGYIVGDELWFTVRPGDKKGLTYAGHSINKPHGGVNLAHELGHNMGSQHPGCGTTVKDSGYPYHDCWFSEHSPHGPFGTYYGYDHITGAIISPSADVGDLMSYNGLNWISDYFWRRMWNSVEGMAASTTSGAVAQSQEPEMVRDVLVVSGRVDPGAPSGKFFRLRILEPGIMPASKQEEITLSSSISGDYWIRQRDLARRLLAEQSFEPVEGSNKDHVFQHFHFAVPYAPGARIFEIVHRNQVLASATASAGAPTVELLSPAGGEMIGDSMTVTWRAEDPDGDPMVYDVQYSANNGKSWGIVAADLITTTVTVNMDGSAGSDGLGRVRVIASDGINTGTDHSLDEQRFTVRKHAPRVGITRPLDGDVKIAGEGFNLMGMAHDVEDGALDGSSLVWSQAGRGKLGTGKGVFLNGLEAGPYTFTLTGTDSDGQSSSDTIRIEVRDPLLLYLPVLTAAR